MANFFTAIANAVANISSLFTPEQKAKRLREKRAKLMEERFSILNAPASVKAAQRLLELDGEVKDIDNYLRN